MTDSMKLATQTKKQVKYAKKKHIINYRKEKTNDRFLVQC